MKLSIKNGCLEIETVNSGKASVSLVYINRTEYATPEIMAILDKYHAKRETPFDWPDMWYHPGLETWVKMLKTDSVEYKLNELEMFVNQCRRNQNVS